MCLETQQWVGSAEILLTTLSDVLLRHAFIHSFVVRLVSCCMLLSTPFSPRSLSLAACHLSFVLQNNASSQIRTLVFLFLSVCRFTALDIEDATTPKHISHDDVNCFALCLCVGVCSRCAAFSHSFCVFETWRCYYALLLPFFLCFYDWMRRHIRNVEKQRSF